MESQSDTNNLPKETILDSAAIACATGGAIAAAVTNYAAAAAIPLAGAVILHIINRKQAMAQMLSRQQIIKAEIVQKLEAINQQQNQLSLTNHQQQNQLFSEQFKNIQGEFSLQLQQQNQDYLGHFESQTREIGQLQQRLEELKQFAQRLETQQQQIVEDVDDLKQIENASQAILSNSNSFEMYYQRGLSHRHLGDREGAIADFSQAIQLNPHCAKAYHVRGILQANLGHRREAVSDLRYAAKYYFEDGDMENYQKTRCLSKELCDGLDEDEVATEPTITQETFDPVTVSHLFEPYLTLKNDL